MPVPSLRWKAMPILTPFAAHKKASFCAMMVPPSCCKSSGMTLPVYGAAKLTFLLPLPVLVNAVMNKLSPTKILFPAENNLSKRPPDCCFEPSPKMLCITILSSIIIKAPLSAIAVSLGSSSISTNCNSSP